MVNAPAVIRIGIDPYIHLGPLTLAWHGLTIALGILIGGVVAGRETRRRGLSVDPLSTIGVILVVAALVGSRIFYLAEHGQLGDPSAWIGTRGFTFYGGFILVAIGLIVYVRRSHLPIAYLDIVAAVLPLGYAIGRIGDVINGEHYGPPTNFFLGVVNTNPAADVPRHDIAYHNGGLYEVLIGAFVFAVVWPLRHRLRRPWSTVWAMLALFAVARFLEFFVRSDSASVALGLETAQWTSVALLVVAAVGAWMTARHYGGAGSTRAQPRRADQSKPGAVPADRPKSTTSRADDGRGAQGRGPSGRR